MSPQPPFSLEQLADLSGETARTIRFWIQNGLLPPARGGGRGAYYDQEHLDRLGFLVRVREQLGGRLPVVLLRQTLEELYRSDPDLVGRVARGEEQLRIAGIGGSFEPPDAAMSLSMKVPRPPAAPPAPSRHSRRAPPPRGDEPGWTTIQIRDGVELRMRTDDPEQVAWLAHVARRLRSWLEEGEP